MLDEGKSVQGLRRTFKHKEGTNIDLELSISTMDHHGYIVWVINARDITEQKKMEDALNKSILDLKHILNETVNALVTLSEKRDLYTAGHQHRVANLAKAIAKEMELSDDQLEEVTLAGTLHDIGKIYVPSDILNKPGKLTVNEMGIIKTHPQVGFEIIKEIPFHGNVAEIVLQHHEKLNGTGYPGGLHDESILLGAKILGVADVVEAMATHRPYRPAIGLNKALAEITTEKGVLYDAFVVEACLSLFESKGYVLEDSRNI